jgi:peptidoglycan/LPS O-acetylase OafA/YrhL
MAEVRFRDDIQGLRALAVLAVVASHAGLPGFAGGFVGVDVFFVISGYLITQVLLRDIGAGQFSLARFYERRVRRLFPALFAMLAVITPVAMLVLMPADLVAFGRSVVATGLFVSNHLFASEAGYFASESFTKPLLHTWSLAVEEQFYIVFPLLLFILMKAGRRVAMAVLGLLLMLSLALSVYAVWRGYAEAFYWAIFRAWELFAGAMLALAALRPPTGRVLREALSLLGLAAILWSVVSYDETTRFPGFAAVPPVLGSVLLIYAAERATAGRMLSLRPLVYVGAISYSLYLWHWPLLALARYWNVAELPAQWTAALVGVAFVLAALSWRFVEQPSRRPGRTMRLVLPGALAAMLLTVGFDAMVQATDGWPARLPEAARLLFAQNDAPEFRPRHRADCFEADELIVDPQNACVLGAAVPPTIAVWGDSHAWALSDGLADLASRKGKSLLLFGRSGCLPVLDSQASGSRCDEFNGLAMARILADPGLGTIIITARSEYLLRPANIGRRQELLKDQVARLTAAGRHVVLVYDVWHVPFIVPHMLARIAAVGKDPFAFSLPYADYLNQQRLPIALLDAVPDDPLVTRVRPEELFCRDGQCRFGADGRAYYYDDQHLSRYGSAVVARLFENLI